MTRVFVPAMSSALALGADKIAAAIVSTAKARGADVSIVRNGSRGMFFIEPLVEVETPAGRIAYGPVTAHDVASLFDAGFLNGGAHALRIGKPEDHPFLAAPDPPDLRPLRNHRSGFAGRLRRAWRAGAASSAPSRSARAAIVDEVTQIRPARARRRGLSDRHQVEDRRRRAGRSQICRLQLRRGRQRHFRRPHGRSKAIPTC